METQIAGLAVWPWTNPCTPLGFVLLICKTKALDWIAFKISIPSRFQSKSNQKHGSQSYDDRGKSLLWGWGVVLLTRNQGCAFVLCLKLPELSLQHVGKRHLPSINAKMLSAVFAAACLSSLVTSQWELRQWFWLGHWARVCSSEKRRSKLWAYQLQKRDESHFVFPDKNIPKTWLDPLPKRIFKKETDKMGWLIFLDGSFILWSISQLSEALLWVCSHGFMFFHTRSPAPDAGCCLARMGWRQGRKSHTPRGS